MTSGTAASLSGAMMCTPATCGMSASSRTRSRQMRRPSAAGSPARFQPRDQRVGDDGAVELFLDPARRLRRAQRRRRRSAAQPCRRCRARRAAPRSGAPRRHPCRTGSARIARRRRAWPASDLRLPAGRRIDRVVGAAEEEVRAAADLAAARQFAGIAQAARGLQKLARVEIEHRLGVGLVAGRSDRRRAASADCARRWRRPRSGRFAARCGCGRGR